MIEILLKGFLVYYSPMFEAWKVPKRPVEVPCDVTQQLVEYWTAVATRTNSSGARAHTGQYSRLPCMHTLIFTWLVVCSVQKSYRNWRRHSALALYKGNFASHSHARFTLADPMPWLASDVVRGKSKRNHLTSRRGPIDTGWMARNAYIRVGWYQGVVQYCTTPWLVRWRSLTYHNSQLRCTCSAPDRPAASGNIKHV